MAKLEIDGYFTIRSDSDNLFATVHPPVGTGLPVEISEVLRKLETFKSVKVDLEMLMASIKEASGKEVCIGTGREERPETGKERIRIEISSDELFAYMTIYDETMTINEIKSELYNQGDVRYGIDEAVIKDALEKKRIYQPILVAMGTPPVHGEDAVLEYKFETDKDIQLQEGHTGRVNFRELRLIESVREDQVLVIKKPAVSGNAGTTVRGKELPHRAGNDIPIPAGKNVELSDDGLVLKSAIDGELLFQYGKINVDPVHIIQGDVDSSIGNINFIGSLIIEGSIRDSFTINTKGNIEVKGCIEKAVVEAGGDIIVEEGIIGKNKCWIKTRGTLFTNFIDSAHIEADEDVIVNESIRSSTVDAKKRVIILGKKGMAVSSRIRVGEEINARVIGSQSESYFEIEVGVLSLVREEIQQLKEELVEDEKDFHEIDTGIKTLVEQKERLGTKFSQEKKNLLIQHIRAKNAIKERLMFISQLLQTFHGKLTQPASGKVSAVDTIHSGVAITIHQLPLIVKEPYHSVTVTVVDNQIKIKSYEEPLNITGYKEPQKSPTTPLYKEQKDLTTTKVADTLIGPKRSSYSSTYETKRVQIRLISTQMGGIPVLRLRVGNIIMIKIIELYKLDGQLRELIHRKRKSVLRAMVEEVIPLDTSRSKVIVKIGEDLEGETIVSNRIKIKRPRRKIPPIIIICVILIAVIFIGVIILK